MERRGEKIGWLGGWLGSFLWVLILAIVTWFRGDNTMGAIGVALFMLAIALNVFFAPWRFPDTRYLFLLLPCYAMVVVCVVWAWLAVGSLEALGLNQFSVFVLLPILLPLWIIGKRRWNDGYQPVPANK